MSTIDPQQIFAGTTAALLLAAGIELGVAFLMRGEKEGTGGEH